MVQALLSLRFLLLLASGGALLGGAMMFWLACAKLLRGVAVLWTEGADAVGEVTAAVMRATDAFLFGVVLLIFAYSIAFDFVFEVSAERRKSLPRWMHSAGVAELKQTLVGVILVYLVVDFATDVAAGGMPADWLALVKPVSILLIAAAFHLMGPSHTAAREP